MTYDFYSVFQSVTWLNKICGNYPFILVRLNKVKRYSLSTVAVTLNLLLFLASTKFFHDCGESVKNKYRLVLHIRFTYIFIENFFVKAKERVEKSAMKTTFRIFIIYLKTYIL